MKKKEPVASAVLQKVPCVVAAGEGTGAGPADQRAPTGQPAAVHTEDRYQSDGAACSTRGEQQQRYLQNQAENAHSYPKHSAKRSM